MSTDRIPLTSVPEQAKYIEVEALSAFQVAMESGRFIGGQAVKEFEQTLCEWYTVKHAIACDSCSAALMATMYGCQVMDGELFATPSMTFVSVAEAAWFLRAKPVYYDVNFENWLMMRFDDVSFEDACRIAIPVALYGKHIPANYYDDFEVVIVDAAQAHGQPYHNDFAAMTLSFFPGKVLGAFGDGGAILTNDDAIARRARAFVNHGRLPGEKYTHGEYGFNFRMDALQAAILKEKYKYLHMWLSGREQVAQWYFEAFASLPEHNLLLPEIGQDGHSWHLFVVTLDDDVNRDQVKIYLNEQNIEAGVHYPVPLHRQPRYQSGQGSAYLSVTEYLAEHGLSLPIYPEMTQSEVSRVVETLMKGVEKCKKTE